VFAPIVVISGIIYHNHGESLSGPKTDHPVLLAANILLVYGLPIMTLVLGIRGVLPGTRSKKLRPDQIRTAMQDAILRKFEQDISLMSPELFGALFHCLIGKKTYQMAAGKSGRPSEQDVAAFEQTIGFALPQDFRSFAMSAFGSLFLEVNENVWPRPKEGAIVPLWHLMYALYVYGLSADAPDFLDIRKQFARFSKGEHRIVPFLRLVGSFNQYCFTPEKRIVLWHAETRKIDPIDITFTELLIREIQTLQERVGKIQNEPNPYAQH